MRLAVILASHIDCKARVDLLRAMIFSATVAQLHAHNEHPEVETRLFVRLSCVAEAESELQKAIDENTLPNLVIHPRQSQFQKIRSEVSSVAMQSYNPQYYVFIDDDDIMNPELLERYIYYLKKIDEPTNPNRVIVSSDVYHDQFTMDTHTLIWHDICFKSSDFVTKTNFSGIGCSQDMVNEFLELFATEIDAGNGLVDTAFTNRIRKNARYNIHIPTVLMFYRQWHNPRSWHTDAPQSASVLEDMAVALGGANFTSRVGAVEELSSPIDVDNDGVPDLYVGPDDAHGASLKKNIESWRDAIIGGAKK